MSKGNTFENDLLLLLFNNTNIANIGDATGVRGSSTVGSLHMALHSSDPGEAGVQTSNEVAYTSYARKALARATGAGGFSVSGNAVATVSDSDFPACTGGTATATHWSIGTSSSGAGKILYKGALSASIAISSGVTPRVNAGTAVTED